MLEYRPDDFEVNLGPEDSLYVIGIVSNLVDIPIWTLRKLDEMGAVIPERKGHTRCYSLKQIRVLKYVHYLMEEKDVNIKGIKIILQMKEGEE